MARLESPNPMYPHIVEIPRMIVRVWKSDYGLPSANPDCLYIMTLLKMHDVDAKIVPSNFPIISDIPSLEYNKRVIHKGSQIVSFLLKDMCKENRTLNKEDLVAIMQEKEKFMDAFGKIFIFECWMDKSNFEYTTSRWYHRVIPFPFVNKYVSARRRQMHRAFTAMLCGEDPQEYMINCYERADHYLDDMVSLLIDQRAFLYKNVPTSFDALVYSYFAIALCTPLQHSYLQKLLRERTMIVRYVKTIARLYFPDFPDDFLYIEPECDRPLTFVGIVLLTVALFGSCAAAYAATEKIIKPKLPQITASVYAATQKIMKPSLTEVIERFNMAYKGIMPIIINKLYSSAITIMEPNTYKFLFESVYLPCTWFMWYRNN